MNNLGLDIIYDSKYILGLNLLCHLDYKLHPNFYPYLKSGVGYRHTKLEYQTKTKSVNITKEEIVPIIKAGMGVNLQKNVVLNLSLAYEAFDNKYYDSRSIQYNLGLVFFFNR